MTNITRIPPPPQADTTDKGILNAWFNRVHDAISRLNTTITNYVHNDLTNIQGGSPTERYHLTGAQYTNATANYLPTGTEGQTLYNNAGVWTATSALYYDDVNYRYGIGTTSPSAWLHIKAGTTAAGSAPLKLTSGSLNTTAEVGAIEYANGRLYFTGIGDRMILNQSENIKTTTTTVAGTVTDTTIDSHVIKANEFAVGRQVEARHLGRYSKATGSDTFDIKLKLNGTLITSFTVPGGSATNQPIDSQCFFTCRSVGTSGTIQLYVKCQLDGTTSYYVSATPATIDTTVDNTFEITLQWGATTAGNTASMDQSWITWKG
jgi:hypothetical protein